jgi:hypothetical protein
LSWNSKYHLTEFFFSKNRTVRVLKEEKGICSDFLEDNPIKALTLGFLFIMSDTPSWHSSE